MFGFTAHVTVRTMKKRLPRENYRHLVIPPKNGRSLVLLSYYLRQRWYRKKQRKTVHQRKLPSYGVPTLFRTGKLSASGEDPTHYTRWNDTGEGVTKTGTVGCTKTTLQADTELGMGIVKFEDLHARLRLRLG